MDDALTLFDRFGGIRPMAKALGERPSTVQSWKTTGRVPSTKQPDVIARGIALGIDVIAHDVVFPLSGRPDARAADGSIVDVDATPISCDHHAFSQRGAA